MKDFSLSREQMIKEQLLPRGIKDNLVLRAFREVPRELFIHDKFYNSAYSDHPLPIGEGQTISQPYIVALMTEKLSLDNNDRVLEIGTGSGYQAAILAKICKEVYSVERFPRLAENAKNILDNLGLDNIKIKVADGTLGWNDYAPYDGILVTASAPEVPNPLIKQLKEGGRLLIPVGGMGTQTLLRLRKIKDQIETEEICGCMFVPLFGKFGWKNDV